MRTVTLDFETYFGKGYSLSEKAWTTESYIKAPQFKVHGAGIKIGEQTTRWVTASKLPQVLAAIPWNKFALAGHNLKFDGGILAWRYGVVPALYVDTLGMSRALIGQHSAKHGLDALGQLLWNDGKKEGLKLTYGVRDLEPWLEQKLASYCIDDVEKTYRLLKYFAPHFPKHEYLALDWTVRKFTQPVLEFDAEMLAEYLDQCKENKRLALEKAGLSSRDILMSNQKYAEALKSLGVVPPVKINKQGKITFAFAKTDQEHKALLEHDNPEVQALVAARLEVKTTIEETRTASYLGVATRDNLWPVDYNYSGAQNTHRDSGAKGAGGNPMNLARGGVLRDSIMAPEGHVLLVFDLAQIECRLALWYGSLHQRSRGMEREALELMANGGDLYSYFAGMMFGRPINKKDDPNERQIGKSAVLGLGFGMGPGRFMDYSITMGAKGVDATLAESTVHLYRNTYCGVKYTWYSLEAAMKRAIDTRQAGLADIAIQSSRDATKAILEQAQWGPTKITLEPLFNHLAFQTGDNNLMVKYPDLMVTPEGMQYRDGNNPNVNIFGGKFMENIVQNGARHIMVDKRTEIAKKFNVVMSTYDEVVLCVPEDEVNNIVPIVKEIMTREHPLYPGLPIGVDYGFHRRYGRAKS